MGNVWENGRNDDKKVWNRISKKFDMEGQSTQIIMSERSSVTLCISIRSNWEEEKYTELGTGGGRRILVW
jgi:hypothetical protein